jgi:hypothetical protein
LENNGNAGISILTPNTSLALIYFGDPENNTSGRITYSHATDTFSISAGATTAFSATSTAIASPLSFDLTGNLNITGDIQGQSGDLRIEAAQTTDGADTGRLLLLPSPSASITRGGYIVVGGNESTSLGNVEIAAGNATGAYVRVLGNLGVSTRLLMATDGVSYFGDNGEIPRVQVHGTSQSDANIGIFSWASGTTSDGRLSFMKTNSNTIGTQGGTALASGVELGTIVWSGQAGASSSDFSRGATIKAVTTGTFSASSAPTSLVFSTTPSASLVPVDRLTIDSTGAITATGTLDIVNVARSGGTASSAGDDLVIDGNANSGITILVPDGSIGSFGVGSTSDGFTGGIQVTTNAVSANSTMTITAGNATAMTLTNTSVTVNNTMAITPGAVTGTAATSVGSTLAVTPSTFTAQTGALAVRTAASIAAPTFAAAAASTYTNASTLFIAGTPVAGTNVTNTNSHAVHVGAGRMFFSASGNTTAAIPALAFRDVDTGIFSSATDTIDFALGGTEAVSFDTSAGAGVGTVNAGAVRLTSTTEASLSSTGHAFQIGASSGVNLTMDNNDIQVRNNGAASAFFVNTDGGNITLGSVSATVSIPGTAALGLSSTVDSIEIGYRNVPRIGVTTRTLVATDNGKCIAASGTVTLNNSVFAAGDVVMIYNNSAAAITLTQGTGVTLRLAGTATTGSRTIDQRGFATIWFNSASEAIVSGNVA